MDDIGWILGLLRLIWDISERHRKKKTPLGKRCEVLRKLNKRYKRH